MSLCQFAFLILRQLRAEGAEKACNGPRLCRGPELEDIERDIGVVAHTTPTKNFFCRIG